MYRRVMPIWPSYLGIVALCLSSAVAAQAIPSDRDGFTQYVADRVKQEIPDAPVAVKSPLTLTIGDLQANLDRIYGYCQRNEEGCSREISQYVKGAVEVYKEANTPPTKDALRVVVRSSQYLKQAQNSMAPGAPSLYFKPVAGDLVAIPAIDSPRTIRMFSEKAGKALGLTADEAYQEGLSNVSRTLKPVLDVAKVAGHNQIGNIVGEPFNTSRLALHESWKPLVDAQQGKLIVAAPATDLVLYIGEDSPTAIDALRTLVQRVMSRAPNRLSNTLLRWTPAGWEVIS